MLRSSGGVLQSLIQNPLYHNRIVTYRPGEEAYPNPGCGPLVVYEDTKKGRKEARMCQVLWGKRTFMHHCTYVPSEETTIFFTFVGEEKDAQKSEFYDHARMDVLKRVWKVCEWQLGDVFRQIILPPYTVLADMVRLDEGLYISTEDTNDLYSDNN